MPQSTAYAFRLPDLTEIVVSAGARGGFERTPPGDLACDGVEGVSLCRRCRVDIEVVLTDMTRSLRCWKAKPRTERFQVQWSALS